MELLKGKKNYFRKEDEKTSLFPPPPPPWNEICEWAKIYNKMKNLVIRYQQYKNFSVLKMQYTKTDKGR
jgi:hypothetical protein